MLAFLRVLPVHVTTINEVMALLRRRLDTGGDTFDLQNRRDESQWYFAHLHLWPHDWPVTGPKNHRGEPSVRQVLLIADVLIRRDHDIEPELLGHFEKIAIFKLIRPAHLDNGIEPHASEETDGYPRVRFCQTGCATRWLSA